MTVPEQQDLVRTISHNLKEHNLSEIKVTVLTEQMYDSVKREVR
jgi:hypothetical protein